MRTLDVYHARAIPKAPHITPTIDAEYGQELYAGRLAACRRFWPAGRTFLIACVLYNNAAAHSIVDITQDTTIAVAANREHAQPLSH